MKHVWAKLGKLGTKVTRLKGDVAFFQFKDKTELELFSQFQPCHITALKSQSHSLLGSLFLHLLLLLSH